MNKDNNKQEMDELRTEYDLSKLKGKKRGKYTERYESATNIIMLESDVHKAFPTSDSVNDALRKLMTKTGKN